jgi:hypothetical protein
MVSKTKNPYIPLLIVILFPYLILLALVCIFTQNIIMEKVFQNNTLYLVLLLIILYIFALIFTIIVFIKNIILKQDSQKLLKINMTIKLIHIPAYVLIFFASLLSFMTIFTMGFSIAFFVFDCMTIFLTGLIGLSGLIRCLIENKLPKKTIILNAILLFVFCLDVISSIIIYKKIKKINDTE